MKNKAIHPPFRELVRDQLVGLGGLRIRARRGVRGLYIGDQCFGLLAEHRLYFRTDDETRPEFVEEEMEPYPKHLDRSFSEFYEVPMSVIGERSVLLKWARRALRTFEEIEHSRHLPHSTWSGQ